MTFRRRPAIKVLSEAAQSYRAKEQHESQGQPRFSTILVGVDGSIAGQRALEWAVIRAHAGNGSLRIVHLVRLPVVWDPYGVALWWGTAPLEAAQQVVDEAAHNARSLAPGLTVSTGVRVGGTASGIVREGKDAELIVLGRSRRRGAILRMFPTVNAQVARRAPGRMVIVGLDDEVLV